MTLPACGDGGAGPEDAPPRAEAAAPATPPAKAVAAPVLESFPRRIEPGLALELAPIATGREGSLDRDARRSRLLALFVERDAAPTPFLAPGPFRATWRGEIEIPRRDRYTFAFAGRGTFRLEIDGEVVLDVTGRHTEPRDGEPVPLKRGRHALVARYRSPLRGSAEVRVSWESRRFAREPIPPAALFHDADADDLRLGRLRRRGRELVAERSCLRCHHDPVLDAEGAMPELAALPPTTAEITVRVTRQWLAAWLRDPRALRPSTHMPRVLHGTPEEVAQKAADIAAAIDENAGSYPATPLRPGDPDRGARLFADLGCIACHGFRPEELGDDPELVPLTHADAKYRTGRLAEFLRAPRQHDAWGRMPDFALSDGEAQDLAAFVRRAGAAPLPPQAAAGVVGDPTRAHERFAEAGCLSCHPPHAEEGYKHPGSFAAALSGPLDRGCLAAEPAARGRAPDFGFDDGERRALRAFAALAGAARASLARRCDSEFAERRIEQNRCTACHTRDGRPSAWTTREELLARFDEPARPLPADGHTEPAQLRPDLTWTGEKLLRGWSERFIAGAIDSPRPWLRPRMPAFPELAPALARGLAAQHGYGDDPAPPEPDPTLVGIGRKLIESEGGFGCVTCHAVAGRQPTAVFEVQGIDFARAAERLRRDWYDRWMLDPARLEPASKMPVYATAEGRTAFTEHLGGDARRQFEAIWHFLHGAPELR